MGYELQKSFTSRERDYSVAHTIDVYTNTHHFVYENESKSNLKIRWDIKRVRGDWRGTGYTATVVMCDTEVTPTFDMPGSFSAVPSLTIPESGLEDPRSGIFNAMTEHIIWFDNKGDIVRDVSVKAIE